MQRLGHPVASFRVTGITPGVDPASSTAFPLKLDYATPTATFTMTMSGFVDSSTLPPSVTMGRKDGYIQLQHIGAVKYSRDMITWEDLYSPYGNTSLPETFADRLFFRAE